MPAEAPLELSRDGAVLTLTLNDLATRNALSPALYDMLGAALAELDLKETGAVILTGAGGHFCSGGNVKRLAANRAGKPEEQRERIELLHRLIRALRATSVPVIAAVEGAAGGAGFSLALACDMIVAAENARFRMAYVRIGLTPDGGGTAFLSRALPPQIVSELVMLGDDIDAPRLHALGVVNRISRPGAALGDAMALAKQLADGPREAIGRAKKLLEAARGASLEAQLDREAEAFVEGLFGHEAGEGTAAFAEKRKPVFNG